MPQSAHLRRLVGVVIGLFVVGLLVAGCGDSEGGDSKIALLLPKESSLYKSNHRSAFESAVEEECGGCEVLYSNAGNDASAQLRQAEAALKKEAEVLVVDPVDPKAAAAIVAKAHAQNVPVVSYDRLIEDADVAAFVSFDEEKTGEVQAEALVKKLKEDGKPNGPIIMINGPAGSAKAAQIKQGAKPVFEAAGVKIAKEYDTPEWKAENSLRETQQALAALGKDGFAGVFGATNNTAAGAISVVRYEGLGLNKRPVTGSGATFDAVQRVMASEQFMTTYNEVGPEATTAAEIAIALAEGEGIPADKVTHRVDNGKGDVPSALLTPVAITQDNLKATVISDGIVETNELCEFYEESCDELEISYSKKAPS